MNLSVTDIDLDTLKSEKTQQPPDATHVMVHKMDNSASFHTVYIKDIPARYNFELAEVINSVAGGATLIRLNEPDNTFYQVKCAIHNWNTYKVLCPLLLQLIKKKIKSNPLNIVECDHYFL